MANYMVEARAPDGQVLFSCEVDRGLVNLQPRGTRGAMLLSEASPWAADFDEKDKVGGDQ